jgi:hypothetical protein
MPTGQGEAPADPRLPGFVLASIVLVLVIDL